jgi:Ca-activated chloride channel family protein
MGVIISQALNSTTLQVNLLDANAKPSETDANMTFYDAGTGAIKYNLVHTFNNAGNPDTLPIDPMPTYNLTVHTIPPVEKQNIELIPGKHNTVAVYCPQGYLNLKTGIKEYKQYLEQQTDINDILDYSEKYMKNLGVVRRANK